MAKPGTDILRELRTKWLKPRLIAATLTSKEYRYLRNTVRVLRLSGVPLTAEQEENVKKFEAVCEAYREMLLGKREANG